MPRRVHDLLQVGPILAERILDRFGGRERDHARALDVLTRHPERLTEVKGIGEPLKDAIIRANNLDHRRTRKSTPTRGAKKPGARLALSGLSARQHHAVIKYLGSTGDATRPAAATALERLQTNPYALLEVPGINYATASRVATTVFRVTNDDSTHNQHANRHVLERAGGVLPLASYRRERAEKDLPRELEAEGVVIHLGCAWLQGECDAAAAIAAWATGRGWPNVLPVPYASADEE